MRIGVLALQGGFARHLDALRDLGHDATAVRSARDLDGVRGLVLPGGESTAMRHLLARDGGALVLRMGALHREGVPILATCAGLILAAREVREPAAASLGWIDVAVSRNAWGRQVASAVAVADDGITRLVLIRAPRIAHVGEGVRVLATLRGEPVLVRDRSTLGATFHPELTDDREIHRLAFGSAASRAA